MHTLTIDQLSQVPWIGTVNGITYEPPVQDMGRMTKISYKKRDTRFPLFYSWAEIIKTISGENHRILDTSCGRGMISQILVFKGNKVWANDIEDYFMADKNSIDFRPLDLNDPMPYPESHFDYVINCESLQYLRGITHFLKESKRVLKDGGHLVLSIPNIHNIAGRLLFLRKGRLKNYSISGDKIHWQIIYLPYLIECLKEIGFRIMGITGNIPNLNTKTRLFNMVMGKFLSHKDDDVIKTAHSLIIDAQLSK